MPKTLKQKQEEAVERQSAHEGRSVEQQLDLIATRRGNSLKERAKLQAVETQPSKRRKKA